MNWKSLIPDALLWRLHLFSLGTRGESFAACWLRRNGYRVIEKNVRIYHDEIDLIAIDKKSRQLVFVEVKTRAETTPGLPVDAVDRKKQKKILRAARHYMQQHQALGELPHRFDIAGIVWYKKKGPEITYYPNAFEGSENVGTSR